MTRDAAWLPLLSSTGNLVTPNLDQSKKYLRSLPERNDSRFHTRKLRVISMRMTRTLFCCLFLIGAAACLTTSSAHAQSDVGTGLEVFPALDLGGLEDTSDKPGTFVAEYTRTDDASGKLSVTATIAQGWHVYSVTQAKGGPTKTTISVVEKSGAKLISDFVPDAPPANSVSKAWPDLTIEEHADKVVWTADVALPAELNGPLEIAVKALVCKTDGACVPIDEKLVAKLVEKKAADSAAVAMPAEDEKPQASTETSADVAAVPFRDSDYVVEWVARVEPAVVKPGQRASLIFTAKPDTEYHVYAAAIDDAESSTNFVITEKSGLLVGTPVPSDEPISEAILPSLPPVDYHASEITWTLPIVIGDEIAAGEKKIEGSIGYQACTDRSCMPPKALKFTAIVSVGEPSATDPTHKSVTLTSAPYAATLDAAAETKWVDKVADKPVNAVSPETTSKRGTDSNPQTGASIGKTPSDTVAMAPPVAGTTETKSTPNDQTAGHGALQVVEQEPALNSSSLPLPLVILMAICGGLILNLMPCVLPVVGLKVMSFAEQAGESRARVLMLNIWYTLGILVVFWSLAATAVLFSFSWGEQFTYFNFRYAVTLLVFAMALSFLGVWEIPIPGFVGGQSTQKLQRKEGVTGAFFKGIFTTMLATPCSGPLLGSVFAFTLGKSALVTSVVFTAVGFGMALPYLMIAIYPGLLAYFPKPGAWMDTFKQLLAFLLLGTVVYLFGGFADEDRMPVFASLIGVWFGCWLIGQVPAWANLDRRLAAWVGGIASASLICVLSFQYLSQRPAVLAWEPYDEARLVQLQKEGRTVLIDFTAKWCVNCIVNYNVAINTAETSKLVEQLNAVPMLADWTDHNEEIKNKLLELKSNSIPVLAIYPGRSPESPIVLRDLLSQGDVLEALRKAGSSLDAKGIAQRDASRAKGGNSAFGVTRVSGTQATGLVPAH
jgi:suppressor for copper-sensitivity B